MYICGACVALTHGALNTGMPADAPITPIHSVAAGEKHERCSFCGKHRLEVPGLAINAAKANAKAKVAGNVAICAQCLSLCDEIIAQGHA